MGFNPLAVVERIKALDTGPIAVGMSGKDSLAAAVLLRDAGIPVRLYHLMYIPDLRHERIWLDYVGRLFSTPVEHVPGAAISRDIKHGRWRFVKPDFIDLPRLTPAQAINNARRVTGCDWVASGEKKIDSIWRRGMLTSLRGVNERTRRTYPVADWNDGQVYAFLRRRRMMLPPFSGSHFGLLSPERLAWLETHYPDDLSRIKAFFPFIGAIPFRERLVSQACT